MVNKLVVERGIKMIKFLFQKEAIENETKKTRHNNFFPENLAEFFLVFQSWPDDSAIGIWNIDMFHLEELLDIRWKDGAIKTVDRK